MLDRRRGAFGLSVLLAVLGGLGSVRAQEQGERELRRRIRELEEENDFLSKKNVQFANRVAETERSYEQLKTTLKEVQDQAVKFAEQMSDAGLAKREMADRLDSLTKSHSALGEENHRLREELDQVTEQLKRKEVALEALSGISAQEPSDRDSAAIARLREELDSVRESARVAQTDRIALLKQIEALKQLLPEEIVAQTLTGLEAGSSGLYEDDPAGLWSEVFGFSTKRYGQMVRGRASWDAADICLAATLAGSLFSTVWIFTVPLRFKKRRRLRRRVAELEERVREADQREATANRPRRQQRVNRGSSVVRRGGPFSPILSAEASEASSESPSARRSGAAHDSGGSDDASITQMIPQLAAVGRSTAPRDEDFDDGEDEIGQTQVISNLGGIDLAEKSRPSAIQSVRPPAGASRSLGSEVDEDDEFSNTQIIPSLSALDVLAKGKTESQLDLPSERPAPRPRKDSGRELLDELEDLIGRKVDEIIQ